MKIALTARIWIRGVRYPTIENLTIVRSQRADDRLSLAVMLLAMAFDESLAGWLSGEVQGLVISARADMGDTSFWTYLAAAISIGWLTRRSGLRLQLLHR